jgi:lysophospholipase L1-like esterase
MKRLVIRYAAFALLTLGLTFTLAEFAARSLLTHVIRDELSQQNGLLEASPEFLIEYVNGNRRFVPHAKVTIKNHYLSGEDVQIETNSMGLRNEELSPQKPQDEFRILVLGDSITAADYLPKADTFVSVLETQLRATHPERTLRVINAGIGNTGTDEALSLLRAYAEQIKPDLVLLAFYLNDSRPPWGFAGEIGDQGWLRRHSVLISTAYRLLQEREWVKKTGIDRFAWIEFSKREGWKNSREEFETFLELARFDWGAAWTLDGQEKTAQDLLTLQKLSDMHAFKVALVAFPVLFQLQTKFDSSSPQAWLQKEALKLKFDYFDLLPVLKNTKAQELYFDHCHPNRAGNQLIGNELAKWLEPLIANRSANRS